MGAFGGGGSIVLHENYDAGRASQTDGLGASVDRIPSTGSEKPAIAGFSISGHRGDITPQPPASRSPADDDTRCPGWPATSTAAR